MKPQHYWMDTQTDQTTDYMYDIRTILKSHFFSAMKFLILFYVTYETRELLLHFQTTIVSMLAAPEHMSCVLCLCSPPSTATGTLSLLTQLFSGTVYLPIYSI